MRKLIRINDNFEAETFIYETRDEKEQRLFDALSMSLRDQCPPDRKDYLCMIQESEEQDCESCWLRWATIPFKKQ